jgi:MFS family permease
MRPLNTARAGSASRALSASVTAGIRTSFRSLRHRNFRLYWWGQLVSLIGTWMQTVAQGWLMYRLSADPFVLSLLAFAQFIPTLLFSLPAGVLADRFDKRKIIILTQGASLLEAAALAALTTSGHATPGSVLVLAFIFGIITAIDLPVRASFVAEMVSTEDLSNAIALNSAVFNAARVVGPAIAGLILATLGEASCFWLNAFSYVAVIVGLLRMNVAPRDRSHLEGVSALSTFRDGMRHVFEVTQLRNLLLLLGVMAGFGFQYSVLLPVYAKDILHSGAGGLGLLTAAFGMGSLLSAVRMTQHLTRWDLRKNLLIGLLVSGIGLGGFAWSRSFVLSMAMGIAAGFGLILYVASTNMMLQITTNDRYRGRVMSLYTVMLVGTAPFGALPSGWIAKHVSAPVATSCSALVLLVGALWIAYRLRVLMQREVEGPTEAAPIDKVG